MGDVSIRFLILWICILGVIYQLPIEWLVYMPNAIVWVVVAGWLAKHAVRIMGRWLNDSFGNER